MAAWNFCVVHSNGKQRVLGFSQNTVGWTAGNEGGAILMVQRADMNRTLLLFVDYPCAPIVVFCIHT